jgi:hypothetical protein
LARLTEAVHVSHRYSSELKGHPDVANARKFSDCFKFSIVSCKLFRIVSSFCSIERLTASGFVIVHLLKWTVSDDVAMRTQEQPCLIDVLDIGHTLETPVNILPFGFRHQSFTVEE